MNNLIKQNRLYGSDNFSDISSQIGGGIETNLELYIPLYGGISSDIWPLITKKWNQHKSLGIRSADKPDAINFLFVPNNKGNIDEPILGRGTFTAVYQLKNEYDKTDMTKYILRLYIRDENISSKHMMNVEKIQNEYKLYEKYMINIYYYGQLTIIDQKFKYYSNSENYEFKPNTMKTYSFDHVITKVYNTIVLDDNYNVIDLNNIKKYLFLYNNVIMLHELEKNKSFHADYKIANVGWEDSDTMNVILIDYDIDTIQHIDKLNNKFVLKNGYVTSIKFPSTYIPEFIKKGNGLKSVPFEQYIKYSIGGLNNIIRGLKIKFIEKEINLPSTLVPNQKIKKLNTDNLGTSLNLLSKNYDDIPDYSEIIAILGWLYVNNKVAK